MSKILTLFGTRPEIIKLMPVIRRLEESPESFETINVSSSQHTDQLRPCTHTFGAASITISRSCATNNLPTKSAFGF